RGPWLYSGFCQAVSSASSPSMKNAPAATEATSSQNVPHEKSPRNPDRCPVAEETFIDIKPVPLFKSRRIEMRDPHLTGLLTETVSGLYPELHNP
ncbi:MAG: hypothetical protein AAFY39_01430, partial [Pseudomonadota bacterium]